MSDPKAICPSCGNTYSVWNLGQRESCHCGGKLFIEYPYSVLIGFIREGRRNNGQEELHELWTRQNPSEEGDSGHGEDNRFRSDNDGKD